ncbi:argonaute-like protein [Mycena floridula]|nr:argonaute-like protein [Mycena floridula]
MPPRGSGRGHGRGAAPSRSDASSGGNGGLPQHGLSCVGVARPGFGSSGTSQSVFVNSFVTTIPEGIIHHYDVIMPSEKFDVALVDKISEAAASANPNAKGPKIYKIRLTKAAEINPETLARFIKGEQSHDNSVLTAITALNVVIRMEPSMKYPFNVRSFFTSRETKDIGSGLELWRGYFQSVRPGIGRMLINVDISTGCMYKAGPLLKLCLEFIGKSDPNALAPARGLPDRERLRLQRFISGIRILTTSHGPNGDVQTPRVIKKLSSAGANKLTFTIREGGSMTVAQYFQKTTNKALQFPDVICVEVGTGALIPLEMCTVPPGQIMRKQVPPEKTKDVLDFATKKPHERLQSITAARDVIAYGQSEYVRSFGMSVEVASGPLRIQARVLKPPVLKYGRGSKQLTITPRDGAWNMVDKRFFKPMEVPSWAIVIYEQQRRFPDDAVNNLIRGLVQACNDVGMKIAPTRHVFYENGQSNIATGLHNAGRRVVEVDKKPPTLMVIVLPEGGNDIYTAVKHFGDVTRGVATQCLKSSKCFRAKPQYYANVCLKINVKLGGINTVPDASSVSVLTDPRNPTIVMGADVIHPAPGSDGKPSFTSLVANVDSDTAKYIAASRVQTSRQEMIEELQPMAEHVLTMYMQYHEKVEHKSPQESIPKRIIFYRDGVSEGQFKQVLEQAACKKLNISPKITVIVVGKRHHVRFFPHKPEEGDRSGNCKAGTVVDRDIGHPTEFDFYLQSHGGLLGTSRPAHYSENEFSPDALQSLSFALCHLYARSTRSVSIVAPMPTLSARAKNHYEPGGVADLSETATNSMDQNQVDTSLEAYKRGFQACTQATIFPHVFLGKSFLLDLRMIADFLAVIDDILLI